MSDVSLGSVQADFDEVLQRSESLWRGLDGSRIFITGATGFFGSWLLGTTLNAVEKLGLDVKICGLSRDPEKFIANSPGLGRRSALTWVKGDVKNFEFPVGDWSHVIHAGVDASANAHAADPLGTFDSIIEGTRRSLNFAGERGVRRFLNISSGAVYGRLTEALPFPDESYGGGPNPLEIRSTYGEAKRAAENLCTVIAGGAGFEAVNARCFAFLGPFQPMHSNFAIGNFIADAVEGKPIVITGDGSPFRSYLYMADLAEALWTLLAHGDAGEAYNVGSMNSIDLVSLANLVKDLLGSPAVTVLKTRDPSAPREVFVPNSKKLSEQFGLGPGLPLEEAILRTASWYRTTLSGLQ